MSTREELDAVNNVLRRIGVADVASVDSDRGKVFKDSFDQGRRLVLSERAWNFAVRSIRLNRVDRTTQELGGFTYGYALPDTLIKVISVGEQPNDRWEQNRIQNQNILACDLDQPNAQVICDIPSNEYVDIPPPIMEYIYYCAGEIIAPRFAPQDVNRIVNMKERARRKAYSYDISQNPMKSWRRQISPLDRAKLSGYHRTLSGSSGVRQSMYRN